MNEHPLSNNSLHCNVANAASVAKAAQLLRNGRLVAFPTETVYGLGALARDDAAIASIYATKGRPSHNPLIVHVADAAMAAHYGVLDERAYALCDTFFPGALTIVVPVRPHALARAVYPGGKTVALRSPAHPVAQALLRDVGEGIAAPSANRSGRISPTSAAHVMDEFSDNAGNCAMVLDGGDTTLGVESTVLDCSGKAVQILRPGSVTRERIAACLPDALWHDGIVDNMTSPGLLSSHYAPRTKVRLCARHADCDEVYVGFGDMPDIAATHTFNLSQAADIDEAASRLYATLRLADCCNASSIAIAPIPNRGIGIAINDRLRRAAS